MAPLLTTTDEDLTSISSAFRHLLKDIRFDLGKDIIRMSLESIVFPDECDEAKVTLIYPAGSTLEIVVGGRISRRTIIQKNWRFAVKEGVLSVTYGVVGETSRKVSFSLKHFKADHFVSVWRKQ